MIKTVILMALGAGGFFGLVGAAGANPVTYTYTSGDVVITGISVDGVSVLGGGSSPEFGFASTSTATIDTVGDTLAFLLAESASGFQTGLANTVTSGSTTLNFNSATIALSGVSVTQPTGQTLQLTQVGSGYTFAAPAGLTVAGSYNLADVGVTKSGKTTTFNSGTTAFDSTKQAFSGSATVLASGDTLQVDGLTLGTWTVDGQSVSVTGNVIFVGAAPVPLPATAWLLLSGLGLCGIGIVRSKQAA